MRKLQAFILVCCSIFPLEHVSIQNTVLHLHPVVNENLCSGRTATEGSTRP